MRMCVCMHAWRLEISLCIIFRGLSVRFGLIPSARLAAAMASACVCLLPLCCQVQGSHRSVTVAWISHGCWRSELSFIHLHQKVLYPLSCLYSLASADLKNNTLQYILIISVMGFSMRVTSLWAMNFDLSHPHLLSILPYGFAPSSQIAHSLFLSVSVCLASRSYIREKSCDICLSGPGLCA